MKFGPNFNSKFDIVSDLNLKLMYKNTTLKEVESCSAGNIYPRPIMNMQFLDAFFLVQSSVSD